jgi:hypothetical protein
VHVRRAGIARKRGEEGVRRLHRRRRPPGAQLPREPEQERLAPHRRVRMGGVVAIEELQRARRVVTGIEGSARVGQPVLLVRERLVGRRRRHPRRGGNRRRRGGGAIRVRGQGAHRRRPRRHHGRRHHGPLERAPVFARPQLDRRRGGLHPHVAPLDGDDGDLPLGLDREDRADHHDPGLPRRNHERMRAVMGGHLGDEPPLLEPHLRRPPADDLVARVRRDAQLRLVADLRDRLSLRGIHDRCARRPQERAPPGTGARRRRHRVQQAGPRGGGELGSRHLAQERCGLRVGGVGRVLQARGALGVGHGITPGPRISSTFVRNSRRAWKSRVHTVFTGHPSWAAISSPVSPSSSYSTSTVRRFSLIVSRTR